MKKLKLLAILPVFLLFSCAQLNSPLSPLDPEDGQQQNEEDPSEENEEQSSENEENNESESEESENNENSETENTKENESEENVTENSEEENSENESQENTEGENNENQTSESENNESESQESESTENETNESEEEENEEFERETLDCGWPQAPLPKNHNNPYELETSSNGNVTWWENKMIEEMPANFRYTYTKSYDDGPGGERASPKFYSYNPSKPKEYPGGLKFDQKGKGFQTAEFVHEGKKLEIRIGITLVPNASGKPDTQNPIADLYYFNNKGKQVGVYTLEQGSITAQKAGSYLTIYATGSYVSSIAYMEFKLRAQPYKSTQNYNFGIGYFNICSWIYG